MIAFSRTTLAVAAITMSLSSSALACLRLTGEVGQPNDAGRIGSLTATDNGVKTCEAVLYDSDRDACMFKTVEFILIFIISDLVYSLHLRLQTELRLYR
jgi:hypothetical protein